MVSEAAINNAQSPENNGAGDAAPIYVSEREKAYDLMSREAYESMRREVGQPSNTGDASDAGPNPSGEHQTHLFDQNGNPSDSAVPSTTPLPEGFPDVELGEPTQVTQSSTDSKPVSTMVRRDANNNVIEQIVSLDDTGKMYRNYQNSDGKWVTEPLQSAEEIEGGYRFKDANGTEVTQWNTGARDIVTKDGNISKLDPNGEIWYHERQAPGGGRERFVREGNQWTRQVGGQVEKIALFKQTPDGTIAYGKVGNDSVTVTGAFPDGQRVTVTENANGSYFEREDNADGNPSRFLSKSAEGGDNLQHDGQGWQLIDPDGTKQYVVLEATADGGYRYRTADGTVVTQSTDGNRVTDKSGAQEDPRIKQLSEKHGVKHEAVMAPDGSVSHNYYIDVDGKKDNRIPILENSAESFEKVEAQVVKARDEMLKDLESRYNIRIGRDGERSQLQRPGGDLRNLIGYTYELRTPRLDELYALQSALEKSQPSNLLNSRRTEGGERLPVEFLKNREENAPHGYYAPNRFTPGYYPAIGMNGPEGDPGASRFQETERVMLHELAHVGQFQRNSEIPGFWENYGKQMGYDPVIKDFKHFDGTKKDLWILQGSEGERYAELKNGPGPNSWGWYRVDGRGQAIDIDGKPIDVTKTKPLDVGDVRKAARITPATDYFPNPAENGADAIAMLRRGEQSRRDLLKGSPEMYEIAKNYDQQEINRSYGVNPDGSPKYVRGLDGRLIENKPGNGDPVRQITVWEAQNARR